MTYVLHYAPDNASLIVRLALEELGADYQTQLVDRRVRAQRAAAHLALNPAGRIPVLQTRDGAIFETAAILLWLSERHGALLPEPGAARRGWCLTWLMFLSNDLQSLLRLQFYVEGRGADLVRAEVQRRMRDAYDLVENAVSEGGFFAGPEVSVLDCYLGPLVRWSALYPPGETAWFDLGAYPRIKAVVSRFEARASVRAAQVAEGMGDRPFTAPRPPVPPEGSAT